MTIKYKSTRGQQTGLSFEEVVLGGLATDKGLYLPESIPQFTTAQIENVSVRWDRGAERQRDRDRGARAYRRPRLWAVRCPGLLFKSLYYSSPANLSFSLSPVSVSSSLTLPPTLSLLSPSLPVSIRLSP